MDFLATTGYRMINIFWRLLFTLTLFFAWTSTNLVIGDNWTFGTSTTWITTCAVLLVVCGVIACLAYPRVRQAMRFIFITHQRITATVLLVAVIVWQIVFVTYVHPSSGFDSGMLHRAAVNAQSIREPEVTSYFSLNQNNLPIMLFMRWLHLVSGQSSWQFFDYLTIGFVDLSVLLNLATIAVLNPRYLSICTYLQVGGLAVFPSILMPYTDAWVMPLVSLILLCAATIYQMDDFSYVAYALAGIGLGASTVVTYFIKPSAIIPIIAMLIVALLTWLGHHCYLTIRGLMITGIVAGFALSVAGGTYYAINRTVSQQTYIQIDKSRIVPAIHFAAMGVYDEGGYNVKQAQAMTVIPTVEQKSAYSKKMLISRLKQLGVTGYVKFLVMKQRNNTADGTFGWLKEGHFFWENQKPKQNGLTNQLKNYIFLYGEHIADFRFIAQFWWVLLLTIIALGWGDQRGFRAVLRLSIVGGFLFLLLFEGGRSRYMIQYLPCFVLLATLAAHRSWQTILILIGRFNGTPAQASPAPTTQTPSSSRP